MLPSFAALVSLAARCCWTKAAVFRSSSGGVAPLHVGDRHLRGKAGLQRALRLHLGQLLGLCRVQEVELLDFAVGCVVPSNCC